MNKKTRHLVHLILCLMLLPLSLPAIVTAAPEQRTALVIGNSAYSAGSLRNPVNDADDMASALKRLGCRDAQKACALGDYGALEFSKSKGYCC